jgi:hypothetical protein
VLELDLLRLGHAEGAADVRERLLREHDRARPHRPDLADKQNVFDRFREEFQAAAILFQKTESRSIDLAVDKQADQPFVAQARRESEFALGDVEGRFGVAERLTVQARHVFERRVAHGRVITVDVQGAHAKLFPRRPRASPRWLFRRRRGADRRRALHLPRL